jgi:hypothetical protein
MFDGATLQGGLLSHVACAAPSAKEKRKAPEKGL